MALNFKVLISGFIVIFFATLLALIFGGFGVAWMISFLGTLLWMNIMFGWIVFVHSARRWPGFKARERFAAIITFQTKPEKWS